MLKQLEELKRKAWEELEAVADIRALESWRVCYLGKKSQLMATLRSLAELPLDERKAVGARANEVKASLEEGLKHREQLLREAKLAVPAGEAGIDITLLSLIHI